MSTKELKLNAAEVHSALAQALDFSFITMQGVAVLSMLDLKADLPVPVSILAKMIAANVTLTMLCIKHDLIDQGALESIWAEHLDEATVRSHSRRLTAMVARTGEVEIEA